MKKLFLTCAAILIAVSQLYAQGEADMKAKFNELNKKLSQMVVDNDFEGMLSYYAENPISMPSYQPMLRSLDAMRESHKQQHEMGMKITAFELTATDVIVEGNIAIEIGTYTVSMDIPEMGAMDDHGKYMNVWEKQDDGSMKIKADIWNTDMNPWEMMQEEHGDYGKHEEMDKDKDDK
jgi:ketosteroid isomerase-like protein